MAERILIEWEQECLLNENKFIPIIYNWTEISCN